MKVNELTKTTILKRINFVLLPLIAIVLLLLAVLVWKQREAQSIRLGKLQARITTLNMLELAKSKIENYIKSCQGYNNMVEMYRKIEPARQTSYITELTQHVLKADTTAFTVRVNFDAPTGGLGQFEVLQGKYEGKVVPSVDNEFTRQKLLDTAQLARTDNVTMTRPYYIMPEGTAAADTFQLISFYQAITGDSGQVTGTTYFDIEAAEFVEMQTQLARAATRANSTAYLFINNTERFVHLAKDGRTIEFSKTMEDMPDSLVSIVRQGYDCEYDDEASRRYYFIIPMNISNFNYQMTMIVTFSYSEMARSISGFTAWLVFITLVAYLLIAALLIYINRYLYRRFNTAEVVFEDD